MFALQMGCVGWLTLDHIIFMHKVNGEKSCRFKGLKETEKEMLKTFASWPKFYPATREMVAAGLFFNGISVMKLWLFVSIVE